MAGDKHAMQRPVEIITAGDTRSLDRADRLDRSGWTYPHSGVAQGAGEMDEVFRQPPMRIGS